MPASRGQCPGRRRDRRADERVPEQRDRDHDGPGRPRHRRLFDENVRTATVAAGSGYTVREAVGAAPNTVLTVEDRIQATAGAVSATATLNTSDRLGRGTRFVQEGGVRRCASGPHQRDAHEREPDVRDEPARRGAAH